MLAMCSCTRPKLRNCALHSSKYDSEELFIRPLNKLLSQKQILFGVLISYNFYNFAYAQFFSTSKND